MCAKIFPGSGKVWIKERIFHEAAYFFPIRFFNIRFLPYFRNEIVVMVSSAFFFFFWL